jgi:hypothetical protein
MSGGVAQRWRGQAWWTGSLLVICLVALFVRPIGTGTRHVRFSKGVMQGVRIGTMDYFVMFPTHGNASMTIFSRCENRIVSPLKFTGKSSSWGSMDVIIGSPTFTRNLMIVF